MDDHDFFEKLLVIFLGIVMFLFLLMMTLMIGVTAYRIIWLGDFPPYETKHRENLNIRHGPLPGGE